MDGEHTGYIVNPQLSYICKNFQNKKSGGAGDVAQLRRCQPAWALDSIGPHHTKQAWMAVCAFRPWTQEVNERACYSRSFSQPPPLWDILRTWRGDWLPVSTPHRISLEDLSPSVVLHMTEKLGYKNSDVINTVLSNRACHILAIYFLLNKKLERYLSGVSGNPPHPTPTPPLAQQHLLSSVAKLPTLDPCCYFSLKPEAQSLECGIKDWQNPFLRWCSWSEMCSKCSPIKVNPAWPTPAGLSSVCLLFPVVCLYSVTS